MVDLTERCVLLYIVLIVYLCQHVQSDSVKDHHADLSKKQLEELEEANEEKHEKELSKIYSSSKANEFLTYDLCMQRMQCPANRKEECSEECKAGNTEEEIEEHSELTKSERRNSLKNAPKQKYETTRNPKKHSSKSKHSSSTIKTDL